VGRRARARHHRPGSDSDRPGDCSSPRPTSS
jgi:hypothetical protein